MLLDPATGELLDPWGGRRDLEARLLRAVDARTFGEDPLRALRAVQFAARYELEVDPATAALCAAMPLAELPAERVFGEIEKLLLKARRPSLGLALLKAWGMLPVVAPELLPLEATPQDPGWHPEGDVWAHTLQVVDEAAALLDDLGDDRPRQLAVMLGALCHDLGKPATTRFEDGRIRSRGHEEAGLPPTTSLLDRWSVHTLLGYDVRAQVLALVAHHLKPGQLYDEREKRERRGDPPPGPQVRARPPLPRGEGRLPRPPARRLRAGGDGVVPRARPRSSTWRCARRSRSSRAGT